MMQKGVNSRYRSALKKDAVCLIKRDTAGAVKTNAVVRQKLTLLSVGRPLLEDGVAFTQMRA